MKNVIQVIGWICIVVIVWSWFTDDENTNQAVAESKPRSDFDNKKICKAGIATMYKQQVSIMSVDTASDGNIRVSYSRPQDGKHFSYRCKLNNGNVLTYDESLTGARWYGSRAGDSQLRYSVVGGKLHIRDIYQSLTGKRETLHENNYTASEL